MENEDRKGRYGLPLPANCHLKLSSEFVGGSAVFVVGDVHGCFDEMIQLMDRASTMEPDILYIFVGDLVNKGPKSKQVLDRVRQDDCLSVVGNHELNCMREARSIEENPNYKLPEKYHWIYDLSNEDLKFIRSLPYTIEIPCLNSLVVHAGLVPGTALHEQCLISMTNMRNIYFDGEKLTPTNKYERGQAWATYWTGPQHVYFGHDVQRGLQLLDHATGLDTGCCLGHCLTGVFINGCRQILSVPAHRVQHVEHEEES